MRVKSQWALVIAAVVLLCLVGWGGSRAQGARSANWEYKIVTKYGVAPNVAEFNKLGEDGWELVMREESLYERRRVDYYFKRAR